MKLFYLRKDKQSAFTRSMNRYINRVVHVYTWFIFLLLIAPLPILAETEDMGRRLYEKHCLVCHGDRGKGDGPAARFLFPKPRDLTVGAFKVRSTPTGSPPTDEDILGIISNGMPGSGMPSHSELKEDEKKAIVQYVKKLGNITEEPLSVIEPGNPPTVSSNLLAKGRELYKKVKCWECHGYTGKGDGPKANKLKDDWKQPAPPNNFTIGIYKGGGTPSDIYIRFTSGMDGSPMPSYEDSLTDEERWAVVYYTLSLAGPAIAKQPTGGKIYAKRVTGHIPADPAAIRWNSITAYKIPLMSLWQEPDTPYRVINIRAANNENEIAFLVEWLDNSKDTSLDVDTFSDAVALQFPLNGTSETPFWMGGKDSRKGVVNIWFWKAYIQEFFDSGNKSAHDSLFENLIAEGFGTLTSNEEGLQVITGKGIWRDGKWQVVFKRTLRGTEGNASFSSGKATPVSFALWNGRERDVDGKKAVSTWYYVVPEAAK